MRTHAGKTPRTLPEEALAPCWYKQPLRHATCMVRPGWRALLPFLFCAVPVAGLSVATQYTTLCRNCAARLCRYTRAVANWNACVAKECVRSVQKDSCPGRCPSPAVHVSTPGRTSLTCAPCSPGTYLPSFTYEASACIPCSPGTFSVRSGASACQACPAGSFQSLAMSTDCGLCAAGSYSSFQGVTQCLPCPPGQYQPDANRTACLTCPQGTVQPLPGSVACVACAGGTYTPANTTLPCQMCPPGQYQPVANRTACLSCPPGQAQPAFGSVGCAACTPGLYQPLAGAAGCLACDPGRYQPALNATACLACAPGYVQPSPRGTACDACSAGLYQPAPNASACLSCPPGLHQPAPNATGCLACGPGRYQPLLAGSACLDCLPGQYQARADGSACLYCTVCPSQSYRSAGCHDLITDAQCRSCTACPGPVVRACSSAEDAVCGRLNPCPPPPPPVYQPWMQDGTVPPADFTCPRLGQYLTTFLVGKGAPECRPCPEGMVGLDRILCVECPPYQAPYSDRASCICRPPASLNATGQCECPDGWAMTASGCQPCPANTYGRRQACYPCPPGRYSSVGATECAPCPVGQYRAPSQPWCASCGPDRYALDPATPASCKSCERRCGAGQVARPCRVNASLFECEACPPLPDNAAWVEGPDCPYRCLPGHFHAGGGCQACSVTACSNGTVLTPCSLLQDGNCDVQCANETMPAEHAWYEEGCRWACEPGYAAVLVDYWVFRYFVCAQA